MQQEENRKDQEIISIEEYLYKRKKIKEREEQKWSPYTASVKEKSSALILAELICKKIIFLRHCHVFLQVCKQVCRHTEEQELKSSKPQRL